MGTGYTRQSAADIVSGNDIEAAPLNAEFNQLRDSFDSSGGHAHDGSTGNGPKLDLTTSTTGTLTAARGGTGAKNNVSATVAPAVTDDSASGYGVGSEWVDVTHDTVYFCVDASVGAAIWTQLGAQTAASAALGALTPAADKVPYFTSTTAAALATLTSFVRTILDDTDASTVLSTLGVSTYIKTLLDDTDASTAQTTLGISTFIKTLLDDVDAATARTTLGAQAQDADLDAIAALSGTNNVYYRSAANTWTAVTFGTGLSFTGGTLDTVTSSLPAALSALSGLTPAADKMAYYTGASTAAMIDLTSTARSLLDDTSTSAMRTTLGVAIGSNVQAWDADLDALAALASNGLIARTGAGTVSARTLTGPANGISVTNGDGVSGNPTLALTNDLSALEALSGTNNIYYRSAADTWTSVTIGTGLSFSSGTLAVSGSTAIAAVRYQKFTASGTYTPNANLVYAEIICVGGGAGGMQANNATSGSAGGGSGGVSLLLATAATIGASKAVTIGAAGTSSLGGGDTSVGTICIAKGAPASGSTSTSAYGAAGAVTTGAVGDITLAGNQGDSSRQNLGGGMGASTPLGFGGGGTGAPLAQQGGTAATGFGAGGGGAASSGGAAQGGGAGSAGYVLIREFCSV
jgi:hypothetical protein